MIDAENRTYLQGGIETPLRGNGPLTGYGYLFFTRPHFLAEDLYLRVVIPPGYLISELVRNHWPTENSALGLGVSGGLWAESQVEFRDGRFEKEESFSGHSAGATLAYYLRGLKVGGLLPLEGQIRANPKYVWYDRTGDTSRRFSPARELPDLRRARGDPSGWYLTQRWTRLGGTYTFSGTQASAFLNAGIAEDTDALSSFRMGGGLRLRAEFPLMLHGYNVEEIFARRFVLTNLAYRFSIWPGQDRVHLQLLGDYAQFEFKY